MPPGPHHSAGMPDFVTPDLSVQSSLISIASPKPLVVFNQSHYAL